MACLKNPEEKKIERLLTVLRTLRNVNRLLAKERNQKKLIKGICNTLVQDRGYYNAWIILFDITGKITAAEEKGVGDKFTTLVELWEKQAIPKCGEKALSTEDVILTEDPQSMCRECHLSQDYGGRGALTINLNYGGRICGILCVSTPKDLIADKEERKLIKEVGRDISFALGSIDAEEAKKQADEALQESEERFRDLIENSPIGISFIQNGKVLYRNPEQQRLFGPPTEISIPFNLDNIHPDDVKKVREMYQALIKGESESCQAEFRFFPEGKAGSKPDIKWVDCRAIKIKYKGDDAILVNMLDITRSKELETFLMIQDKMASLGHMAAGLAHEIRNPLSGIYIYLNTLEKRLHKLQNSKKNLEIIEQIQSAAHKIESVIRRVMNFSRPGEPKFKLSNINDPIVEAIELASVTLRKSDIKINRILTQNLPLCLIDPPLIEEVLLNLITNAADAMKESKADKKIEIMTSRVKDKIEISVSDSGPGVPFYLRSKIFDPFYTSKSDSSGIGLSISHRIIADHGGSIEVGASKWGGAKFNVKIPIKDRE